MNKQFVQRKYRKTNGGGVNRDECWIKLNEILISLLASMKIEIRSNT